MPATHNQLNTTDSDTGVTLASLVAEANAWIMASLGYSVPLDHVCQRLHTRDARNRHLAMPIVEHKYHPQPRTTPLAPEVLVYGDLTLLTYSSHDDYFVLSRPTSLDEVEREICGPAGICNDYVDYQVAFRRGKCLPYRLHYIDYWGRPNYLDKSNPEVLPSDCDWDVMWDWLDNAYRDVKIEWLT